VLCCLFPISLSLSLSLPWNTFRCRVLYNYCSFPNVSFAILLIIYELYFH
jgi:hypothetical protein